MSSFQLHDVTNSIDHQLAEGKSTIGRGNDCTIRILSSSVSRKHGEFEVANGELRFSDLGSSNGSYLNGQLVSDGVVLNGGDNLSLGDFQFTVIVVGESATAADNDDATRLAGSAPVAPAADGEAIPAMWSESAGLENASGTQFFVEEAASEGVSAYRAGKIEAPPIGEVPRLLGLSPAIKGKVFELRGAGVSGSQTWKLGRDEQSVDLMIPEPSVSGQHAQLVGDGARWKIVNWMSTNGTFVNGQRGLTTYLKSGDVIRMGSAELAFELPAAWTNAAGSAKSNSKMGWLGRLVQWFKRK